MKFKFVSAGKKENIEGAGFYSGQVYLEEKYDGSRYGLELAEDGWHAWSRGSIDNIANIPYIEMDRIKLRLPIGTVFDCEVIVMDADRKVRWEKARSVMGTKEYNPDIEEATLMIFDIQHLGDEDLTKTSYLERRKKLKALFGGYEYLPADTYSRLRNTHLAIPKVFSMKSLSDLWHLVVETGKGEGIMMKLEKPANYGKDWVKVKKEATIDAFIIGTTKGKGKYEGMIGALEVAVMNGGVIWPIGKISSLGDVANRVEATEFALANTLKNRTIEVKFNEVTKNKKLRHGRFIRWRPDKPAEECLLEQLDD
jgi:ATP-dependent DNA ligase